MTLTHLWISLAVLGALLLSAAWWGWQHGGLALMQLGLGTC